MHFSRADIRQEQHIRRQDQIPAVTRILIFKYLRSFVFTR